MAKGEWRKTGGGWKEKEKEKVTMQLKAVKRTAKTNFAVSKRKRSFRSKANIHERHFPRCNQPAATFFFFFSKALCVEDSNNTGADAFVDRKKKKRKEKKRGETVAQLESKQNSKAVQHVPPSFFFVPLNVCLSNYRGYLGHTHTKKKKTGS